MKRKISENGFNRGTVPASEDHLPGTMKKKISESGLIQEAVLFREGSYSASGLIHRVVLFREWSHSESGLIEGAVLFRKWCGMVLESVLKRREVCHLWFQCRGQVLVLVKI